MTLDQNNLANDTGTLTISGNASGGTFSSTLDVYFDICTAPGSGGVGCVAARRRSATATSFHKSGHGLVADVPFVGRDRDRPAGDQDANEHTGLERVS